MRISIPVVLAVLIGGCTPPQGPAPSTLTNLGSGYADLDGSIINYEYEDFAGFEVSVGEGKIKWHGVSGYFRDAIREVSPQISRVADNVYFLSWQTFGSGGDNVVLNFNSMEVYAHLNPNSDNPPTLEMIHGVIHCRDSEDCVFPDREVSTREEIQAIIRSNVEEQNLPPRGDPERNRVPRSEADRIARSELAGLAMRYETPEGPIRIEVFGNETRVREASDPSPRRFQTFATRIADDLYFISWLGPLGGNHIVVNRRSMQVFDHISPTGERAEMIYDLTCFGSAISC